MLLTWSVGTSTASGKEVEVAATAPVALVQAIPTQNGASFRSRRFALGFAAVVWAIAPLIKTSHQSNPIFECIGSLILLWSMYLQTLGDNQS
jgi:hypothetical protein